MRLISGLSARVTGRSGIATLTSSPRPRRRCRILVEKARRKERRKHGGGRLRVELKGADFLAKETSEHLEVLDEALNKLAAEDPAKAELVKLRFFAGLTMPEIATVMKISLATAERHWTYARTWLYAELKDRNETADP
jgi:RNA polymerase sigma factor (TIGR02999 family)